MNGQLEDVATKEANAVAHLALVALDAVVPHFDGFNALRHQRGSDGVLVLDENGEGEWTYAVGEIRVNAPGGPIDLLRELLVVGDAPAPDRVEVQTLQQPARDARHGQIDLRKLEPDVSHTRAGNLQRPDRSAHASLGRVQHRAHSADARAQTDRHELVHATQHGRR